MPYALLSVYDKTNIDSFASFLLSKGYTLLSTGGTKRFLEQKQIEVQDITSITNFPEMLDGRVKTLHPMVHGGILYRRTMPSHQEVVQEHQIPSIDLVVVNLYPFFEKVKEDITFDDKVEFIDIGGPTMLRSAAKNFHDVLVISNPNDYEMVQQEMQKGSVSLETRRHLAAKVFNLTAAYDASISSFLFENEIFPEYLNASYQKQMDLRYGENPHQSAAFYTSTIEQGAMKDFDQLQGKALSFNNIRDMDVAWKVVSEFNEIACCALKHSTPCGVAIANSIAQAYQMAHDCDPISIFGGIVAFNHTVDEQTANKLIDIFLEIVIAPGFTEEALSILSKKKNLRIIQTKHKPNDPLDYVKVDGGLLVQDADLNTSKQYKVVTNRKPTEEEMKHLQFAMNIVKHVKSNAIVVANGFMATGIGTGETNRIWAAQQAIERSGGGTVLASDAFFPFDDVVKLAASNTISAIIQPGGSMRDQESIDACNELDIAMVFTGMRHFKH